MNNNKYVDIIIKDDIEFADGYKFPKQEIYKNAYKFNDHNNNICYEINEDEKHIVKDENVKLIIELGPTTMELYDLIKDSGSESGSAIIEWGYF